MAEKITHPLSELRDAAERHFTYGQRILAMRKQPDDSHQVTYLYYVGKVMSDGVLVSLVPLDTTIPANHIVDAYTQSQGHAHGHTRESMRRADVDLSAIEQLSSGEERVLRMLNVGKVEVVNYLKKRCLRDRDSLATPNERTTAEALTEISDFGYEAYAVLSRFEGITIKMHNVKLVQNYGPEVAIPERLRGEDAYTLATTLWGVYDAFQTTLLQRLYAERGQVDKKIHQYGSKTTQLFFAGLDIATLRARDIILDEGCKKVGQDFIDARAVLATSIGRLQAAGAWMRENENTQPRQRN